MDAQDHRLRRAGPPGARVRHEPARRRGVASPSGPRAATSSSRRSGAPPRSPRTASASPRRSSSRTPTRRSGPSWSRRSPRRPTTSPVTAPPPPPCWPGRMVREGLPQRGRRRQPDGPEAGHRAGASRPPSRRSRQLVEGRRREGADRPGRLHLGQQRPRDRRAHRRGDGQGRQGRRHHRRGVEHLRHGHRPRRGHALRQGLHLALLRDRPRAHGGRPRRRLRAARSSSKITAVRDLLPVLEKVMQGGKPLADHRRGRRGRGPGDARRQQDPRHLQVGRRQGPRLRRAPQGDAAGHGHPHRWPGHHRGGRPQAREHHARPARPGPQDHRHQGRDHHRRGRRRRRRHQGPHPPDQERDREHRLRLRPGEAAGAPGQAVRRRRRPQGRRGHRGRAQGEEAPHRGRGLHRQGRGRGGRRPRRRRGPAALRRPPSSTLRAEARRATRPPGPASWPAPSRSRSSRSPINAGMEGGVVVDRVRNLEGWRGLQRRHRRVRGPHRQACPTRPR